MPKKVIVTVDAQAGISVDYQQFEGPQCLEAGKQLHALLQQWGVQVEQTRMTPKPELLMHPGTQHELTQAESARETEGYHDRA